MLNKVLSVLGVLVVCLVLIGFFAFDSTLRKQSDGFGKKLAVLNKDIKAGTIIKEEDVKETTVKNELIVNGAVLYSDRATLSNKKAVIDMKANEQITLDRFVDSTKVVDGGKKLVTFTTNIVDSVGANVKVGDIVDIWLKARPDSATRKEPLILFSAVKIEQLKNQANVEVTTGEQGIPYLCSITLSDEQIKIFRTLVPDAGNPELFFTLYTNQETKKAEYYKNNK